MNEEHLQDTACYDCHRCTGSTDRFCVEQCLRCQGLLTPSMYDHRYPHYEYINFPKTNIYYEPSQQPYTPYYGSYFRPMLTYR